MLFIGNNWVGKSDFKKPSNDKSMYGIKCSKCGGMTIVSESTCTCNPENKSELRLTVLDFAYWLEVNSSEMINYDPDKSVEKYIKYLDKSLGGLGHEKT